MPRIREYFSEYAPPKFYAAAYTYFSSVFDKRAATRVTKHDENCWRITSLKNEQYVFAPSPKFAIRFDDNGKFNFGHQKVSRYINQGFVDVSPGDVVIDVGAFIGEFTTYAASKGARVIALEPDPISATCLRLNTEKYDNVTVIEGVAWKNNGEIQMNFGTDPTENSVLGIDEGETIRQEGMDAITLETLAKNNDIEEINFLKADGEGAEPEILEGIGNCPVEKLAIDCSPERDGRSTNSEVIDWLEMNGYEVKESEEVVFGHI